MWCITIICQVVYLLKRLKEKQPAGLLFLSWKKPLFFLNLHLPLVWRSYSIITSTHTVTFTSLQKCRSSFVFWMNNFHKVWIKPQTFNHFIFISSDWGVLCKLISHHFQETRDEPWPSFHFQTCRIWSKLWKGSIEQQFFSSCVWCRCEPLLFVVLLFGNKGFWWRRVIQTGECITFNMLDFMCDFSPWRVYQLGICKT